MPAMAWKELDGIFVLVHGNEDPPDSEWDVYVDAIRNTVAARNGFRALVYSPGVGPNMRQRQRLNAVAAGARGFHRTAVLTTSTVSRAITTLLGLRWPDIRAFEPSRLEDAMDHLEASEPEKSELRIVLGELRLQMGHMGEL